MKKTLFLAALLMMVGISMWAQRPPFIIRDLATGDSLAVIHVKYSDVVISAEVTLAKETNRINISQSISIDTHTCYGPKWEGLKNELCDDNGYCWWTCPEFDETRKVVCGLIGTDGDSNHIGLIFPCGRYRITIAMPLTEQHTFMVEQLDMEE